MSGQQQFDLAGPIPDPPDKPHSAKLAWAHTYRDRLPRKGVFLKHKDRIPIVHWCVSHQDIFRANSLTSFAEELRLFANIELRVDNATFGKLIGTSGSWVKAHRRLRDEEIQETGTIVPEDDYLNAMDQWLEAIDGRVRERQDEKAAVNVEAQNEKLRTQIIEMDMAKRMRDRSRREEMLEASAEADVPAATEGTAAETAAETAAAEAIATLEEWEDDDNELHWSDSDRDVHEERIIRERNRPVIPILISSNPSANTSRGSSVVGTKRARSTPASAASKKLKPASKDPAVIVSEQLGDAMERSMSGLSAQLGVIAGNLAPPAEQGQRLLKLEEQLATVKAGQAVDSKKLDTLLAMMIAKDGQK